MRWLGFSATVALVALAVGSAHGGTTVGDLDDVAAVDKNCVAQVFGYVSEGRAPVRGQERFDHFKKRYATEIDSRSGPFVSFIVIGGDRSQGDDAAALPQCGRSADLR